MAKQTTEFIPLLPIRQTVAFPGFLLPLRVSRTGSLNALERAKAESSAILLVAQRDGTKELNPTAADLYQVGMLSQIEKLRGSRDDGYNVVVRGVTRFRVTEVREKDGMLEGKGEAWEDIADLEEGTRAALLESMKTLASEILELLPADMRQFSN